MNELIKVAVSEEWGEFIKDMTPEECKNHIRNLCCEDTSTEDEAEENYMSVDEYVEYKVDECMDNLEAGWDVNYGGYHYEPMFEKDIRNADLDKKALEFLKNLTDEDIRLEAKLMNMKDKEITDELTSYILDHEDLKVKIIDYIKSDAKDHLDEIRDRTEYLHKKGLIKEDDFSRGLYDCECFYIEAIIKAIGINVRKIVI